MLSLLNLPSVITSALTFLTPILQGLIGFGGWYFSNLWDGLKIVMANVSTWLVVATVAAGTSYSAVQYFEKDCPKQTMSKPTTKSNWDPFKNGGG